MFTLAFTLLYVGAKYLTLRRSTEKIGSLDETSETEVDIQDAAPASFQFYIEDTEENDVFFNNVLIEEYITLPYVLEEIANDTNTSIDQLVEETENEIVPSTQDSERVKVIHVNRDPSSNLQAIYVNIGNEEKNLRVVEHFHDFLLSDRIPFLEDKDIFIFKTPYIVEMDSVDTEDFPQNIESIHNWSPLRSGIEGIVLGLVIATAFFIAFNFFSKKLSYFFFYTIFDEDYFILVDKNIENQQEITDILSYPKEKNIVILQENNLETVYPEFERTFNSLIENKYLSQVDNLMNIQDPKAVDQLVYVVKEGETKRTWYNKQRKIEKSFSTPVVVIQINRTKAS